MKITRMQLFNKEYQSAIDAHSRGLEGRSRVCARRAAAALIAKYLEIHNIEHASMNSLELILFLQQQTNNPELAQLLADYSKPVNPDHHLDDGVDLVASIAALANYLEINMEKSNGNI